MPERAGLEPELVLGLVQVESAFRKYAISTVGARLVIGGTAASSSPGDLQGPGSEVTEFTSTNLAFGYDPAPAGGGSDVYSFTGTKYVIAGASFG